MSFRFHEYSGGKNVQLFQSATILIENFMILQEYNPSSLQKQIELVVTSGRGYHDSPIVIGDTLENNIKILRQKIYYDRYRRFSEDPIGIFLREYALCNFIKELNRRTILSSQS